MEKSEDSFKTNLGHTFSYNLSLKKEHNPTTDLNFLFLLYTGNRGI